MDTIKSKWDSLLQSRPDIRDLVGNTKLIGGDINHNDKQEMIFNFIAKRGTFSYNEATGEFRKKLEIRLGMVEELKGEGLCRELLPGMLIFDFNLSVQHFNHKSAKGG